MGGEGSIRLNVKGDRRSLRFRARNLQFHSVYLPNNRHGSEPETAALLDVLIGPNDVFYDVGSNWGYYSLYIASRDDFAGQVHAFEPMPGTFADLQSVVQQAGLEKQITCHRVGTSDSAGTAHMNLPDGIHSGMAAISANGVEIKLAALDEMGLPLPAVIKMDVEGHEIKALNGARKILTEHKPMLVFESWLHNDKPHETLGPFELLQSMGYVFFEPAFYLRDGNGSAFAAPGSGELAESQLNKLALFEFQPRERFLLGMLFNVLACHASQRHKLEALFTPVS
jgi:FkbM family methyltransferase